MEGKHGPEKVIRSPTNDVVAPGYGSDQSGVQTTYYDGHEKLGLWTRLGCTPESFKRRSAVNGVTGLNETLKPRHLHMIAIGGSIGAGLFVGSGSALSRGVCPPPMPLYTRHKGH
jgi:hypothetical protein